MEQVYGTLDFAHFNYIVISRILKSYRLFFLLTLLALVSCRDNTPPPQGPSKEASSQNHWVPGPVIGNFDLLAVDFIDPQRGWAVGDIDPAGKGGAIYATIDGGRSWRSIASSPEVLSSVKFITPTRGWVAGYAGRIERTDDGGLNWKTQRVEREGEVLNSIFFIDDRHGWAAGGVVGVGGLILRTVNGGESWEPVETGRVENFWAVRFSSPTRGWITGEDGIILLTDDGGQTWKPLVSGTTKALIGLAAPPSGPIVAVGEGGVILRSDDGEKWTSVESDTKETLNSVVAADKIFCAVGQRGVTLRSVDAGQTWSASPTLSSRDLMAVDLIDETHGFAVGQRGVSQLLEP